jgi:predicted transposase YbfD/YdcC
MHLAPTNDTMGCKARIMVELATVVNFKEPNQRAKCKAKKRPEKNNKSQSLFRTLLNSSRFLHTIGSNKILANHIRYILKMEAGASDHFTKMAENDIAIIEMVSGMAIDLE